MIIEFRKRPWSGFLLGAGTVLLIGLMWLNLAPPPAYGQLADSAAQRNEMIKELRGVNQKLTEITGLLREIRNDARQDKPDKDSKSKQP
ncbi:MAG: hypothetical protein ABIG44_01335 [Planctomycetota bacterium]